MLGRFAIVLALGACGRLSFEEQLATPGSDAGGDAEPPAMAVPLAKFAFEESEGTVVGGGAHEATVVGFVAFGQPGRVGKALGFGGEGYLELVDQAAFTNLPAVTIAAWVQVQAPAPELGFGLLGKMRNNGDVDFGLNFSAPDRIQMVTANADNYRSLYTADPIQLDTWMHLAAVYDPATNRRDIYINGVLAALDPNGAFGVDQSGPMNHTGPVRIGGYRWEDSGGDIGKLVGLVDEAAFWDVPLSEEQICIAAGGTRGAASCTLP